MLVGRVIGRVVATVKSKGLEGVKLLLVQPLDQDLKPSGGAIVAADATHNAGPGELIHFEGGREAALALDPWFVPVDHAVVGIIDQMTVRGESRPTGPEFPAAAPTPASRGKARS